MPAHSQGRSDLMPGYHVVKDLTKFGLFVKKEPNPMKIPLCEKFKDVIEPLIKPQWWVRMKGLADAGLKVKRWLTNVNDWCISRQLWWGHRIPTYMIVFDGEDSTETDATEWIVAKSEDEAQAMAEAKFGPKKFPLEQDPDSLSGHVVQRRTVADGYASVRLTGSVPFTEVHCHSLIRDSEGRKMNKSLGNIVDPIDIISGTDLESFHPKLLISNLQEDEVARATKYRKTAFPNGIPECGAAALRSTGVFQEHKDLYQFFYDELCDVVIENSRSILSVGIPEEQNSVQQALFRTLDTSLRLMHPSMPFITEELWQRVPRQRGDTTPTIMPAPYPAHDTGLDFYADALNYELGLGCLCTGVSDLAAEYGIRAGGRAYVKPTTADSQANAQLPTIKALCGKSIGEVNVIGQEAAKDAIPKGCAVFVISSDIAVLLEVGSRTPDVDAELVKLRAKLQKS
ncbi:hypothetical protein B0T25DRAFT_576557 [Lasiosphaeria hispida]|uniref:valine--tRNA ligase n=1 Tax=Lasiosphaeria hispida TaxID=260671 RepID=A0AAJ0HX15_9PEZI|nr:hypothetical protein B0T25DRAFT_576557 [Lasiosphaeria hispida]